MRSPARLAALAAAILAMSACTVTSTGQPTADTKGTPSRTTSSLPPPSESSPEPTPTVEMPPRPRDISLVALLDPCALYSQAQRTQLKVTDIERGESSAKNFKGMKECVLSVDGQDPTYEYKVLAVTTVGVERWLTGEHNIETELITVQDFPAVGFQWRGVEDTSCDIAVDVTDGQHLWFRIVALDGGFQPQQLCQMVSTATDMAMTTLKASG